MCEDFFRLTLNAARRHAFDAVSTAPNGHIVPISEPTRALEQNALIHAALTDADKKFNRKIDDIDLDDLDIDEDDGIDEGDEDDGIDPDDIDPGDIEIKGPRIPPN